MVESSHQEFAQQQQIGVLAQVEQTSFHEAAHTDYELHKRYLV